jgi:hypothetical protein
MDLTDDLARLHPSGTYRRDGHVTRLPRTPVLVSCAGLIAFASAGRNAQAQEQDTSPSREDLASSVRSHPIDKDQGTNPFRGSTFIFDQSMTTQTTQLQPSPELSYVPLYELWLSFRPRYSFDEHWSLRGRFDYTKELTNNQATTLYREDVFGDIWTDLVYTSVLDKLWDGTKANVGLRALWPTSKVSQANGTYVTLGAVASVQHKFEIHGDDAPALNDFHLRLSVTYLHPFTSATTPTEYGNFDYQRQDVDGHSFVSDQVQGTTLVNHTFWGVFDTGLQITPKLAVTADAILINQWHYRPPTVYAQPLTGSVLIPRTNDAQFTQNVWVIADVDYTLFDELSLGFGYYNLANALGPDGQRRGIWGSNNIWWSPDARFFFDITANLDVLFDDASHHRYSIKDAAEAARQQHIADLQPR